MKKFDAIEGLRGWLAWAVVFTHLAYMSGFTAPLWGPLFRSLGLPAVLVFIIISGFVITHLILERRQYYPSYLARRFARIFPLFAVTCFVGFFLNDLLAAALGRPDFKDPEFARLVRAVASSNHEYLWQHVLAHASMLHGLISNNVLPYSEYAFNMPAWSLSLEWQFYLIAPAVIWALRKKPQFILGLAIAAGIFGFAFKRLFWGTAQPGALPVAMSYFAVGICSRIAYSTQFERVAWLPFAVALAVIFFPFEDLRPFLIWLVVFFGLQASNFSQPDIISRVYALLLKSDLALYFGSRSYSTYLCHYLVMSVIVWLFFASSSAIPNMFVLACISIPCIIAVSEVAYRYVEVPGIRWGKRVADLIDRRFGYSAILIERSRDPSELRPAAARRIGAAEAE